MPIADNSPPTAEAEETPLRMIEFAEADGLADGRNRQTAKVVLPQPRLGRFSIGVRTRWDRSQLSGSGGTLSVPLVTPSDGKRRRTAGRCHCGP